MKSIYTSGKLIAFIVITLFIVTGIFAQEPLVEPDVQASSGLSGKVVGTKGKPIAGFTFMIRSMQNLKGPPPPIGMLPFAFEELLEDQNREGKPRAISKTKTDAEGAFSVTNIQPGTVQIYPVPKAMLDALEDDAPNLPPEIQENLPPELQQNLLPQLQRIPPMRLMHPGRMESEMQILSIRLNKVTFFYAERPGPFRGFAFGLKPGVNIEDVKITVKKRLKFRARIVYADGTPLANAEADMTMKFRGGEFGSGGGTHGTDCFTDADGYFTQYRNEPGFYTLSIRYKTFAGGAGPFLLKEDVEPENIVIKLNGNPVTKQPSGDIKEFDNVKARRFVEGLLNKDNVRKPIMRQAAKPAKPTKITWIINPANAHAYAKIQCQDWHDAQQKAIAEGAHLVSINDEEEQFWLEVIFGRSFWIGLNDVEKEGVWVWDSGEPVTYTNWTTHEFPPDPSPETERDYVAIALHDHEGGWQSAGPNSHLWQMTRYAIIEKDGLISKIPKAPELEDE